MKKWWNNIRKLSCNSYGKFEAYYRNMTTKELKGRLKKLWMMPVFFLLSIIMILLSIGLLKGNMESVQFSLISIVPALYIVFDEERKQRKRAIMDILEAREEIL